MAEVPVDERSERDRRVHERCEHIAEALGLEVSTVKHLAGLRTALEAPEGLEGIAAYFESEGTPEDLYERCRARVERLEAELVHAGDRMADLEAELAEAEDYIATLEADDA